MQAARDMFNSVPLARFVEDLSVLAQSHGFAMTLLAANKRCKKGNRQEIHFPDGSRYVGIRSYTWVCSAVSEGAGFAIEGRCRIIAVTDIAAHPSASER